MSYVKALCGLISVFIKKDKKFEIHSSNIVIIEANFLDMTDVKTLEVSDFIEEYSEKKRIVFGI